MAAEHTPSVDGPASPDWALLNAVLLHHLGMASASSFAHCFSWGPVLQYVPEQVRTINVQQECGPSTAKTAEMVYLHVGVTKPDPLVPAWTQSHWFGRKGSRLKESGVFLHVKPPPSVAKGEWVGDFVVSLPHYEGKRTGTPPPLGRNGM